MLSQAQVFRLRNLLTVILGGIETGNIELSIQAVRQAEEVLRVTRPWMSCSRCPVSLFPISLFPVED